MAGEFVSNRSRYQRPQYRHCRRDHWHEPDIFDAQSHLRHVQRKKRKETADAWRKIIVKVVRTKAIVFATSIDIYLPPKKTNRRHLSDIRFVLMSFFLGKSFSISIFSVDAMVAIANEQPGQSSQERLRMSRSIRTTWGRLLCWLIAYFHREASILRALEMLKKKLCADNSYL